MTFIQGSTNNLTIDDADLTLLNGNVHARGLTIAGIQVSVTHGLQTVSNVSNSTSNTIQFTSDTTGFVTTANAEIGKDLIISGNVHVSSNATIAVDSNVVMEHKGPHRRLPKAVPLKKYPEIEFEYGKLDANETTFTYTQAGYTVKGTNSNTGQTSGPGPGRTPWKVFSDLNDGGQWQPTGFSHDTGNNGSADNVAAAPVFGSDNTKGAWVSLELPKKIKLQSVYVNSPGTSNERVGIGKLYGSNNNSDWVTIKDDYTLTYSGSNANDTVNSAVAYKYIVFQVRATGGGAQVQVNKIRYYGYEEDPPLGNTSIDTTFTSVMNTPQTTGVKVYTDAKLSSDFTNRVTGPDATGTSATYDETGKYWTLNGTLTSNLSVEANTFLEGDQPHSVSMWFNSSNLEANVSNTCVFSISDQEHLNSQNLDLQSNTWHNLTYAYQGEGGSRVTYLDGRKVAEDQAEDTFGDYPPFAMTGYSQGGYTVSASDTYQSYYPYLAFNKVVNTASDYWFAGDDTGGVGIDAYTGSVGGDHSYIGSDNLGGYTGIWIKLEMPHKLALSYIEFYQVNNSMIYTPRDFYVIGSNDDITWDLIHRETSTAADSTFTSGRPITTNSVNNRNKYKYIAIVVDRTVNDNRLGIGEIKFYGHRENDLVRLPDPTRVLKYPHIAITGPAQRGYVASASSNYNNLDQYAGWNAFNETVDDPDGWVSYPGSYSSGTPSIYSGVSQPDKLTGIDATSSGGDTSRNGSWLKIEVPHKLKLSQMKLFRRQANQRIVEGFIYGSNDNSTFYQISNNLSQITNIGTYSNTIPLVINSTDTTTPFKQFVVQVTQNDTTTYTNVGNLELYGTEEATPVPIQIGGGNIDRVANFRVYDTFIDENQALEIWDAQKDEFGRAKSSMTLHKGRLGIGTTEPEGRLAVLDEPHNLEEFPPRAMTAGETYFEGHGVFKASSEWNRNSDYEPFAAFNKYTNDIDAIVSQDRMWWSSVSTFTGNPGVFNGDTTKNIGGYTGVGLKLEMPYSILCNRIDLYPRNPYGSPPYSQNPRAFKFIASKDNEFWDLLHEETNFVDTGGHAHPFHINTTQYYKYFAIVVTGVAGNTTLVSFVDLQFFGTREQGQSVLHDGQLTLTKNLNVPRIGPALDADDTPRRDRLVVEYNTSTNPTFEGAVRDTSGRGLNGIMYNGASYDANEKALKFVGSSSTTANSSDKIQTRYDWGSTAPAHTFSVWFKRTANLTDWEWICSFGRANNTGGNPGILISGDSHSEGGNIISFDIFNDQVTVQHTVGLHEWTHVVATFNAASTSWSPDNCKIYVNGELKAGTNAVVGPFNLVGNEITLGATHEGKRGFTGCISNFKLYDVALTAEEAKTLYNMGRLGNAIKTPLQIEAPVDIRGDIRYITNIRPLPKQTMWDHESNGHFTRGIYPITGTQGGSKVYNMLCEPDWCGGGWMCAAQIPRGKDVVTTTINLFEDEYGDPSNLAWNNDFAVPMNIFSNNSGYDLDVMLVLLGGTQAGRAGAGGARNGGIYRGVNLTQALNSGWPTNGSYPVNISTSGLASSYDGFHFTSRTPSGFNFQPYKANSGWRLSFASKDSYYMSFNDADINTMGWLLHTDGNILQYTYSYVHGGGGAQSNIANTSWAAVRFFVRPKRY